jgi:hypothetical protein
MAASPVRASRPPPERPSTALLDQQALEARQKVVALGKREFLEQLSSLGRAFAADPGNPGSYACTNCERCANCMFCKECAGCYQCTHCIRCEGCSNCSHCVDSKSCQSSAYLLQCDACTHSAYLVMCRNLSDCNYCFGCVGLSSKDFIPQRRLSSKGVLRGDGSVAEGPRAAPRRASLRGYRRAASSRGVLGVPLTRGRLKAFPRGFAPFARGPATGCGGD